MIKKQKNPFFIALKELDFDLKNIVKFDIREQSLEVFPFSLNNKNSLKIFYIENKVTILYKGKLTYLTNPDINISAYDDYQENYNRLISKYRKECCEKNNKNESNVFNHGLGSLRGVSERSKILHNTYIFNDKEEKVFEELLESKLNSRHTKKLINFNDKVGNFYFELFSYEIKNKSSLIDFYSKVNNSRLSYNNDIFSPNKYDEIDVNDFVLYHDNVSKKVQYIIREFISYKITKSIPKKYFNL